MVTALLEQKDARNRRQATARLLAEKGFAAVSINELSQAAGSSDGVASKEKLYAAVLEEQFLPVMEALTAALNRPQLSPAERLRLSVETIVDLRHRHPLWVQLLDNELICPTTSGQAMVQKYIAHSLQAIRTVLDAGIVAGEFKADLNKKNVELFWYAMCHLDAKRLFFPFPQEPVHGDVTRIFDFLLGGIAGDR